MTSLLLTSVKLNSTLSLTNAVVMAATQAMFRRLKIGTDSINGGLLCKKSNGWINCFLSHLHRSIGSRLYKYSLNFSTVQIEGLKIVTQAVHDKGGKILCKLWHFGRVAHSMYTGELPLAPSAQAWHGKVPRTKDKEYEMPRTLSTKKAKT